MNYGSQEYGRAETLYSAVIERIKAKDFEGFEGAFEKFNKNEPKLSGDLICIQECASYCEVDEITEYLGKR